MISIRMGNKSILKAKAAPSLPDGTYVDLFHDVEIKSDLTLAAMFGTEDVEFVHSERSAWLTVSNGEGPRQLQIGIYEDGDETGIFLTDEMGSIFDIHDVTLGYLISSKVE